MLSYIIGTSANLNFLIFCIRAREREVFYIIGEANVGVRPQGFITGSAVRRSRPGELLLYYRQTNKGGRRSGI